MFSEHKLNKKKRNKLVTKRVSFSVEDLIQKYQKHLIDL